RLAALLVDPPPQPPSLQGGGSKAIEGSGVSVSPQANSPLPAGRGAGGVGQTAWNAFARAAEASRASFRASAECRLCFAVHRAHTDLPKLIANANAKLTAEPETQSWHTPDGIHYG